MTPRRPRIALSLARPIGERARSNNLYRQALERAGASVIELQPTDSPPADFDGLLLAGGGDIDPARYGQPIDGSDPATFDPERDELELGLARSATERDVPVLGICRGFQLLNVALGGGLVQDVAGHRPAAAGEVVQHSGVSVEAGSRLAEALGSAPLTVNSRHHQAVTRAVLARGLRVSAEVDGTVEAFEAPAKRWLVAVQWHPERTDEVSAGAVRIFDAFVAEAARWRSSTGS